MANPQTSFRHTTFHGPSMLATRRRTIARVTLRAQLDQLRRTGRFDCWKLHWKPIYDEKGEHWPVPAHLFWDSDINKWVEGACYFMGRVGESESKIESETEAAGGSYHHYDAEVDAAVREVVTDMRKAQREDGFLNLHYIVVEPLKRWSNLEDMHELYNAGHLIEAALAHHDRYQDDEFLAAALRYFELIRKTFGPDEEAGQLRGYAGHPEIELALLRLYRATGRAEVYELARFFLEERGNWRGAPAGDKKTERQHYYSWERERRGESAWERPDHYRMHRELTFWYCQAHAPLLEQTSVEGHAVRAMYLLTGAADLLCLHQHGGDSTTTTKLPNAAEWRATLLRLWDNMVDRKMYLTGGIGAMDQWEGFGIDYFLPQGTDEGGCYAETCAAIGVIFLAERLLSLDADADAAGGPDGRFADVLELCLYNAVMTAMSLDGRAFTYVNQLASSDADPSARSAWFDVSCCPPNLTRLFGSLGGYLWHFGPGDGKTSDAYVNVHLYTTARLTFDLPDAGSITLAQESDWPWDGTVRFHLTTAARTTLRLRIPAWARGDFTLTPPAQQQLRSGYLTLDPGYTRAHPEFTLRVGGFTPRYVAPHPRTGQTTVALARGPLIYCAEDVDNSWELEAEGGNGGGNHFRDVALRAGEPVVEEPRVLRATVPASGGGGPRTEGKIAVAVKDKQEGEIPIEPESYVALRTVCWDRGAAVEERVRRAKRTGADPGLIVGPEFAGVKTGVRREIVFVPYYMRANRGGKGHMRVGMARV